MIFNLVKEIGGFRYWETGKEQMVFIYSFILRGWYLNEYPVSSLKDSEKIISELQRRVHTAYDYKF